MTEMQENEKEETTTPEAEASGADDVAADDDTAEVSEETKKNGNKLLPFLIIVAVAAVATLYLASLKSKVAPNEGAADDDVTMQEEEEVSEELQALRNGDDAILLSDFTPGPCGDTFTHTPIGFSFTCPDGWWHPFETAEADAEDPNHFVYETAFTSKEVEAPGELGEDGSWLAIDAGTRAEVCDTAPGADAPDVTPVTIDGEEAFMQDVGLQDGTGNTLFSGRRVAVTHKSICYQISLFHLGGEPLNEEEESLLNDILASFRFNR